MDSEMTGGVVGSHSKTKTKKCWLVVTLPLLAIGLSACGSEAPAQSKSQSDAGKSTSQASSTTSSAGNGDGRSGFKNPASAAESFVTQVLGERYKKACVAAAPAEGSQKEIKSKCDDPKSWKVLESLHKAWAKPGVKMPPNSKVKVTDVTKEGGTASVADSDITLDGRTLREIELMGSQGNTKSFSFSLKLQKSDRSWHISDFEISF